MYQYNANFECLTLNDSSFNATYFYYDRWKKVGNIKKIKYMCHNKCPPCDEQKLTQMLLDKCSDIELHYDEGTVKFILPNIHKITSITFVMITLLPNIINTLYNLNTIEIHVWCYFDFSCLEEITVNIHTIKLVCGTYKEDMISNFHLLNSMTRIKTFIFVAYLGTFFDVEKIFTRDDLKYIRIEK